MKITTEERDAIRILVQMGKDFGYGNLIAHLQTAWARYLVDNCGFDEQGARVASGSGYPFTMQDDLMERGEWDETGKKYRSQQ